MKEDSITRISLQEAILRQGEGQTDWDLLRRERAAGIEPAKAPEEGDVDWSQAKVYLPPSKTAISIRIDDDVLEFFRTGGAGYQTRINAVLRSYKDMEECRSGQGKRTETER